MLCHVSDAPRHHAHYSKTSWALEYVRRLNNTLRSYYHYPFKHTWNVSYLVAIVSFVPYVRLAGGMRGCVVFRQFFFCVLFCVFQSHRQYNGFCCEPTSTYVMHALFLPITTMRYMSCLMEMCFWEQKLPHRTYLRKCTMKNDTCNATARNMRSSWRCLVMAPLPTNERFFSLFLGEGPKQWTRMEKMKWNGERRETCVMSAINLNLPFTQRARVCVWECMVSIKIPLML